MATSTQVDQVKNQLLLLHLSDIHFEEPNCIDPDTDPDHTVRKILLNDVRDMVEILGTVDAILVSGDIAFKCHSDEYITAAKWLNEVTATSGCSPKCVFTVPGNHDLDRENAKARRVKGVRLVISKELLKMDKEFRATLKDDDSSKHLFEPMEEYIKFAAAYECGIYPDRPFWIQEIEINPTWKLKIHGLTTTFFSGPENDSRGDLYLGDIQRAFAPDDGIIRLALMHHPPDWLSDDEKTDDALWEGCELHLLGHKHKNRYHATDNSIRIAASAVNPARNEPNWEPGYNFIKLNMGEKGGKHVLEAETHIRIWQNSPDKFVPKFTRAKSTVFKKKLILEKKPSSTCKNTIKTETDLKDHTKLKNKEESSSLQCDKIEESVMSNRDISFDFWRKLSTSQRRGIMEQLNLLEEGENSLSETIRYHRAFKRAQERGQMDSIENKINIILGNQ
jgi:predicted MPP superfamily phosphohydrolase